MATERNRPNSGQAGQRPKIAHVATVDMALRYMLLDQLLSLQESGYEVHGVSAGGKNMRFVEKAGIPVHAIPLTRRLTPLADLRALVMLYRLFKKEKFALVHTHTPKAGLLGQLAAKLAGVPVIVNTIHGFYFHEHMPAWQRRFYILMEKLAACCSDRILSQNSEDIETAVREGICRRELIQFLGNGIGIDRFNPRRIDEAVVAAKREELSIPANAVVVGFVGRLVKEKGILELFEAARRIRRSVPNLRLLLVGPIDLAKSDALRPEVAGQFGVEDICTFTGRRQDMADLYHMMDVLALPSYREGFPRTPMEASLMEVPSVATDIRGCREAVENGRNGLLVPPRDVPALTDAIERLLLDRDLAMEMGKAGREMALQRFDQERVFATIKSEYRRLLESRELAAPPERDVARAAARRNPDLELAAASVETSQSN